jgi:hypothetical protein
MKKWQKKINRRVNYYDRSWVADVAECKRSEWPMLSIRAYRNDGFRNGAEWMLKEIIHLMRQKKHKCDKMRREGATTAEKTVPTVAAALYSRIIKDLTE